MSKQWHIEEAQERFKEIVKAAHDEGPQIVAEDGVTTAIVLPIKHSRQLSNGKVQRSLKELLLAPEARTDSLVPPRHELFATSENDDR